MPAYEVILRRPHGDKVHYEHGHRAEVGDVMTIKGRPWIVVEKEPPFELRRIERLICVPREIRYP